ncbi:MAG: alpha/beta hydrolase [Gracilimonas sp.]|nr:alpha/beta hydrolase [Gracilimonas sp.]
MKKLTFLLSIILLFTPSCTPTETVDRASLTVDLWSDSLSADVERETKLSSPEDDVIRITEVQHPSMEVYFANSISPNPAVLIFPGGGYGILAYDLEGTEVAKWLNGIGITAIVVKYTVPNNRESAFADGQRAIKIVRENAAKWNIDPTKIGVLGFSAGGHLAARLSTDFDSSSYPKKDSTDELSYRPDFSILVYPAYLNIEGSDKLAPEIILSDDIPPTFILQTKDDKRFVGGTKIFVEALESTSTKYKFHLIEKGGHGYGLRADTSLTISNWPNWTKEWLINQEILE